MATANEEKKEDKTSADASQQKKESDKAKADDQADQADDQNDDQEEPIDHAAEAEKLRDQLGKAEHTIQQLKKDKKQPIIADDSEEQDDVDAKIEKGFSRLEQHIVARDIASTLASLSSDPAEREHIKAVYDLRIQKSGFTPEAILSDLEAAKTLANERKTTRENKEIKRAIIAKKNTTGAGGGSNQDKAEAEEKSTVKVTDAEAALLARRGLKPTDVKVSARR